MRSGLTVLKGVVFLAGVMMLTGAKTNGCGPDFGDGDPPPECENGTIAEDGECVPVEPVCPDGTYEQLVCADHPVANEDGTQNPPSDCWTECVPIEPVCPEGTYEQLVCSGDEPVPPGGQGGGFEGVPADDSVNSDVCWTECVPSEPTCPEGYHEEYVCSDDCQENCYLECVPDGGEGCPEGTHLEITCDDMGGCYEHCVPDSYCGPDEHLETVCEDDFSNPEGGYCYDVCVPNDPCGPGAHEEWVCEDPNSPEGGVCYSTCVPDEQPCPAGQHEEWVCEEDPMSPEGGICYPVCVDDGPFECPPGTHYDEFCEPTLDGGVNCQGYCVDDGMGGGEPPPNQ